MSIETKFLCPVKMYGVTQCALVTMNTTYDREREGGGGGGGRDRDRQREGVCVENICVLVKRWSEEWTPGSSLPLLSVHSIRCVAWQQRIHDVAN